MAETESPRGSCVCVPPVPTQPSVETSRKTKPQDGGVCATEHTVVVVVAVAVVVVVVVVVGSKMGSNYYEKVGQIPVWDLTTGWYNE